MSQKYTIQDLESGNIKLPIGTHVTVHNESTIPEGTLAIYNGLIHNMYAEFKLLNYILHDNLQYEDNLTTLPITAYVLLTNMHDIKE